MSHRFSPQTAPTRLWAKVAKVTYTFRCPVCRKTFRATEPGEPMCTGPSETRDEHELVVMHLLAMDNDEVHPLFAEKRANGPLLLP